MMKLALFLAPGPPSPLTPIQVLMRLIAKETRTPTNSPLRPEIRGSLRNAHLDQPLSGSGLSGSHSPPFLRTPGP